jgi:hypothetical protein
LNGLLRAGDDHGVEAEQRSGERRSNGPEEDAAFHGVPPACEGGAEAHCRTVFMRRGKLTLRNLVRTDLTRE